MRRLNRKGQVTSLEFGVFVIMVVLALVALQRYIRAAYGGRLKSGAASIGSPFIPGMTTGSTTTVTNTSSNQGNSASDSRTDYNEQTAGVW